jgi:3-hydroxyisobutyrate dehydrogenase-like beta-hydroxyacid dehydrogenase
MTQKVGLIGLGNAGLALATPIIRKYAVVGYDVDASRRALATAAGAAVAPAASWRNATS